MDSILSEFNERLSWSFMKAFGSAKVDRIKPIYGGGSGSLTLLVERGEHQYFVKMERGDSAWRNPHQYTSLKMAAATGIAPRCYFANERARVAITDYIESKPLSLFPGGIDGIAQAAGDLLRKLQNLHSFPTFLNYPELISRVWTKLLNSSLFGPSVLEAHNRKFEDICAQSSQMLLPLVSSHNDPVPRNVLFDGNRLWLIDFDTAYSNNVFVDGAIIADSFQMSATTENLMLDAWFGAAQKCFDRDAYEMTKALTRLYYASVVLNAACASLEKVHSRDLSVPTVSEFHQAVHCGTFQRGTPHTKYILGKMYLFSFLTGEPPPGLDAALSSNSISRCASFGAEIYS